MIFSLLSRLTKLKGSPPTTTSLINMSTSSTLFFVEHHVLDKEAWGEFFGKTLTAVKDKSPEDAAVDPIWGGNKVLLTSSSVDKDETLCLWQLPAGSTKADCQDFVDMSTGRAPIVKNIVYEVQGSMGIQNLNHETYIKDLQKIAKEGSVQGFADDGELWFVHHNIPDKAVWDAMFGEKVGLVKGKSTSKGITEAWEVGDGAKAVMWCGLGDGDAVCLWSMPKGTTESDFQAMIDKFCGTASKNDGFKLEPSTCIGGCLVHPDFYAQEAIAYANSVSI